MQIKVDRKLIWCKVDLGAIGFTSGFSQDSIYYGGWTNHCRAIDRNEAENPVPNNLSRLENVPDDPLPIDDSFPNE